MSCVSLRERGEGFGADAGVVVAGEMAGFGIFFHVLPVVLTELLGLSVSSFYCKRDSCIATVAVHQAHHKILQRCSSQWGHRICSVGSRRLAAPHGPRLVDRARPRLFRR